jgi:hypothetical protein
MPSQKHVSSVCVQGGGDPWRARSPLPTTLTLVCARAVERDPDDDAVPAVVAQVVVWGSFLPMIRQAWDPAGGRAAAVAATLEMLLAYATPANQQHLFAVIDATRAALERAIDDCDLPPWPPALQRASPRIAIASACAWRRALALLIAVFRFEGQLSQDLMWDLAGERLLRCKLLPVVDAALAEAKQGSKVGAAVAVARAAAVVMAVPLGWVSAEGSRWQRLKQMGREVIACAGIAGNSDLVTRGIHAIRSGLAI